LGPPPREGSLFRGLVGLLSVTGSLIGFGGLFFIAIPAGNRDALMLALGIVFGWGSAVVQSEYGASNTGRKMADLGLRSMERR
jgi:drug/metabolite transporter (DMT)-like permease